MTLREARRSVRDRLARAGTAEAAREADLLLAAVLDCPLGALPSRGEQTLTAFQAERLERMARRREAREPLQYILGRWEFYGLEFWVGPGVLIPRPDTETLVDAALNDLRARPGAEVLDLCAGSGAVGIAVAVHAPDARVTLLEKYDPAYYYAVQNMGHNNLYHGTVLRGDVFTGPEGLETDLLLSNPPYIPAGELPGLMPEVRREPSVALNGGADGLDFYRAICRLWLPAVRPGGGVMVEVGAGQAEAVARMFREAGLQSVAQLPDLNGIPRVVTGRKQQWKG